MTPRSGNARVLSACDLMFVTVLSSVTMLALVTALSSSEALIARQSAMAVGLLPAGVGAGLRGLLRDWVAVPLVFSLPYPAIGIAGAIMFRWFRRPPATLYSVLLALPPAIMLLWSWESYPPHLFWEIGLRMAVLVAVFHPLSRWLSTRRGNPPDQGDEWLRAIAIALAMAPGLMLDMNIGRYVEHGWSAYRLSDALYLLVLMMLLAIRFGSRPRLMAAICTLMTLYLFSPPARRLVGLE